MKKILYYLPVVIGFCFYLFLAIISTFESINPFVCIALLLLLIGAVLLNKNKWWGSIFGILIGCLLIYMGTQETGQIIKETPFGIIMIVYYMICGVISYKNR